MRLFSFIHVASVEKEKDEDGGFGGSDEEDGDYGDYIDYDDYEEEDYEEEEQGRQRASTLSVNKVGFWNFFFFTEMYRFPSCENENAQEKMFLKISVIAGSFLQAECWWTKTSGHSRIPGKVSKPRRQHLDHFILQQRAL